MDCTLDRRLLDGYLDGELGFERTLEVEAHLASCPSCSAEVQKWKEIRGAIQKSGLRYAAPAALESRIRKLAPSSSESAARKAPRAWRWLWAGGGAAFATAVWLIAFLAASGSGGGAMPAQLLVASHVRSLMADHLMDVVSTDQHTVKPWFDGKLEFAPPVQDFADQGYPLAGGRLDYLENRAVAVLVYRRALHPINLYIWPAARNGKTNIEIQTVQGYNVLSWRKDNFEFRAVSDLNTAELRDFAHLVSP